VFRRELALLKAADNVNVVALLVRSGYSRKLSVKAQVEPVGVLLRSLFRLELVRLTDPGIRHLRPRWQMPDLRFRREVAAQLKSVRLHCGVILLRLITFQIVSFEVFDNLICQSAFQYFQPCKVIYCSHGQSRIAVVEAAEGAPEIDLQVSIE